MLQSHMPFGATCVNKTASQLDAYRPLANRTSFGGHHKMLVTVGGGGRREAGE